MKVFKYMLIFLSLLLVSCNLGTTNNQEELQEDKTGGVTVEAHIFVPDWNNPKVSDSRVIDPHSTSIELYKNFGNTLVDTINFTPSGGVEVISFTGLDAGTYEVGEFQIIIYNSELQPLTMGENIESITLSPVGSNALVFSSIPVSPLHVTTIETVDTHSLADDDHLFLSIDVVEDEIYEVVYERTSITGDIDLYLFDEFGHSISNEVIIEDIYEQKKLVFVPKSTGTYYLAFHAFMGSGDVSFNYDFNISPENGTLSVSGTLHFPPALAGTPVYIKATYDLVVSIVLEKEVTRDGNTTLDYVIPGIPDDKDVSIYAVVDNDNSSTVNSVHGTLGDFTGSYKEVFEIGFNHITGIDVYLEEIFQVTGTVNFPDWVPVGTQVYIAKIYKDGKLAGSFGGYPVDEYSGPWISKNYSTIAHPGTYRILFVADLDDSNVYYDDYFEEFRNASLSDSNFYDVVTGGDYYFLSQEFTVVDSDVSLLSGTAYPAAVITGTVVLPEQKSYFYYRVFADDDPDVTNGVISSFSGRDISGSYLDYFNYSLIVPEGAAMFIGAHVYFGYYEDELTPDDYYTFLDDVSPEVYYDGYVAEDLYVGPHVNILTGSFQLPPGINADGYQFRVGNVTQGVWNDGVVPPGTGTGGSFGYSLEGFELGDDQEITLFIDIDVNGLDNSPNAGDVYGFLKEITLDNALGQTLDFVESSIAAPDVIGSASFPESVNSVNYQIWIDGEVEESGTVSGYGLDYGLKFVEPGTRTISVVLDMNDDGIFGNSGDYLGKTTVYVGAEDITAPAITVDELGIIVEGEITLSEDMGYNTDIYVVLESSTGGDYYEYFHYLITDDDMLADVIPYRFQNVVEDSYALYVITDLNANYSIDTGEFFAFYPYGLLYEQEDIYIYQDIYDLNFVVDPSATY